MRISEFIYEVKKLGYRVDVGVDNDVFIWVRNNNDDALVMIDNTKTYGVSTDFYEFRQLNDKDKKELLNVVLKYIKTPIEQRKEPKKKYRLKLPLSLLGFKPTYVFYNRKTEEYFVDDIDRWPCQSEQDYFTEEEIDAMPNQEFIQTLIKEEVE